MIPNSKLELLKNARREAWIVLWAWGVFLVWVVGYSYLRGYQHSDESSLIRWGLAVSPEKAPLKLVLGLPEWIFYGIFAPWLLAMIFTVVFGLRVLKDDDLGEDREDVQSTAASGQSGER